MLYPTGYKKVHYRHLPVVLTHSTLDKRLYLAQRANWRNENCDSILFFVLPNDVMFKIWWLSSNVLSLWIFSFVELN